MVVGLLALQGDYEMHRRALSALGADVREVRTERDLAGLFGLIIPGGESTTMTLLLDDGLRQPLLRFCEHHPVWGTCAGMIMLSKDSSDPRVRPLGLMEIEIIRNGYGRQVHSFEADVRVAEEIGDATKPLKGIFIRAPRIVSFGSGVKPLAWLGDEVIAVQQGHLLASSFHPELTSDGRLHRYFLSLH